MKLQQSTMCAILAVLHMASRPQEHIPANEIAEVYGVSQHHLAKVLRTLSVAGIVESTRGAGGGCSFVGDARKITLFDIIRLFESGWLKAPESAPAPPSGEAEELYRVMGEVDRHTAATLQSVTLQTILNNARRTAKRRAAGEGREKAVAAQ